MKKVIYILVFSMLLTSVFGTLSVGAEQETTGACGDDIVWYYDSLFGSLIITGTGEMYDSSGETPWYQYHDQIKRIIVSEGITSIGGDAFFGCNAAEYIELADSVRYIGPGAISYCSSLKTAVLSKNVVTIDLVAFDNCRNLKYVFYGGTQSDWSNVYVDIGNECLSKARFFFAGDACPHEWEYDSTAPATYTSDGENIYVCSICFGKTSEMILRIISDIAGDATGDGDVTMKDVLLIRRSIAGAEDIDEVYYPNGDYNGDGSVDMKDILALRRYIAGIDE